MTVELYISIALIFWLLFLAFALAATSGKEHGPDSIVELITMCLWPAIAAAMWPAVLLVGLSIVFVRGYMKFLPKVIAMMLDASETTLKTIEALANKGYKIEVMSGSGFISVTKPKRESEVESKPDPTTEENKNV